MLGTTNQINYRVVVRRDPDDLNFLIADVVGVAGAHAAGRTLAELDAQLRDVLPLLVDDPAAAEADDLVLDWVQDSGEPVVLIAGSATHGTLGTVADLG